MAEYNTIIIVLRFPVPSSPLVIVAAFSIVMAERIRQLVADTIGCDVKDVQDDADFFGLGGDSVSAMRLVAAVRQTGLHGFNMQVVYEHSRISEMIGHCERNPGSEKSPVSAASKSQKENNDNNVPTMIENFKIIDACLKQTGIETSAIEALAPALRLQPFQIHLVHPMRFTITQGSVGRLLAVLKKLYQDDSMLRTRLFSHDGAYYQVVVKEEFTCCLLYTSPSPRDGLLSRMPSSA